MAQSLGAELHTHVKRALAEAGLPADVGLHLMTSGIRST